MIGKKSRLLIACMLSGVALAGAAVADIQLRHTVTGEILSLNDALPDGRDTPAVQYFLQTGRDPYVEVAGCLPRAKDLYLSACSGCHGHLAEGKIGPGLNDSYWTYPKNTTDQGFFETLFGGARAQMGPQYLSLTLDDMLLVMAWVRHVYTGPPAEAEWLTAEQQKQFKSYVESKDRVQPSNNAQPACKPVFN
jgi:cytochrome c-L